MTNFHRTRNALVDVLSARSKQRVQVLLAEASKPVRYAVRVVILCQEVDHARNSRLSNKDRTQTLYCLCRWLRLTDKDGTLWVATEKFIAFLPPNAKNFQVTQEKNTAVRLAQAKDGRVWLGGYIENETCVKPVSVAELVPQAKNPQIKLNAIDLLFDREGGLWMVSYPNGPASPRR